MFETFNVPGLYIAVQPVLALAAGYTTTKVRQSSELLRFSQPSTLELLDVTAEYAISVSF
jgi:actin-related protein 3